MKKHIKSAFLLGALCLSSAFFTAPVQAEKAGTSLPSFLSKNYKLVGTVKGKYVLGWDRSKFENQPEFPTLDFKTNGDAYHTTNFYFQPDMSPEKWEAAHHTPFKPRSTGGGGFYQIKGFKCRGESLKLWFENGQYVTIKHDDDQDFACTNKGVELEDASYGSVPNGGDWKIEDCVEPVELYKLYNFSAKYRPVAVTQGTNAVLITSDDETPLKEYQKAVTDKAFLQECKAYYDTAH